MTTMTTFDWLAWWQSVPPGIALLALLPIALAIVAYGADRIERCRGRH